MTKWETSELKKIGSSDELKLTPLKENGTFFKPVIIWVVRVDEDLYVRSYKGKKGSWYQHVQVNHKGRISAGGITKDVNFVNISEDDQIMNDNIDKEYGSKYKKYGKTYVDPMQSSESRATTIKLDPVK